MTGRELIAHVCATAENLDAEISFRIVHRDEHGCVMHRQSVEAVFLINGKVLTEGSNITEREVAV